MSRIQNNSVTDILSVACRNRSPDLKVIEDVLTRLKKANRLPVSLVAQCLIQILSNRKQQITRDDFTSVIKSVEKLIEIEDRCLKEIIQLNHATNPPPILKKNSGEKRRTPKTSANVKKDLNKRGNRSSRKIPQGFRVSTPSERSPPPILRKRFDSSLLDQMKYSKKSSKASERRKSVDTYYTNQSLAGDLEKARTRHDRFASVTSFEADYNDNLEEKKVHKKSSGVGKTLKSFSFTPLYTLFKTMAFDPEKALGKNARKSSYEQYEDVSDLEEELLKLVCVEHHKKADVNFMLSVRITPNIDAATSEKLNYPDLKQDTELCSYQPVWHRLLNHGKLRLLSTIIDNVEVCYRKTMFEVKTSFVEKSEEVDVDFGMAERGVSIPETRVKLIEKKEKFIISSKTALHEVCGWTRKKYKELEKQGVTEKQVLDFIQKLIEKGCDVNSVCMHREDNPKLIQKLVRKYKQDNNLRLKKLPEDVAFYIWQTPLSLAIRAKNKSLVKLLARNGANMKHGDVFYPRVSGIKFDADKNPDGSTDEDLGFRMAADLETVPTEYNLKDVYYRTIEFDTNFSDWKFIINNEKLYDLSLAEKKRSRPNRKKR